MKLRELKKKLLDKNNQLPVDKRRRSSVRSTFRKKNFGHKAGEKSIYKKKNQSSNNLQENILVNKVKYEKDAINYKKSIGLNALNKNENYNNLDFEIIENEDESDSDESSFDESNLDESNLNYMKIVGITGSKGKSTVAYIVHEYLKSLNCKSMLYSSIKVDSPVSYASIDEAVEMPIYNEDTLLDIIEEAESYNTDYIVVEVNERSIAKGLVADIPFNVRALTNIYHNHNKEQYSKEEYVGLKKSFFTNIPEEDNCKCVVGLTGTISRDEFNDILCLNNCDKITYGTKFISEAKNADYTNLDCLLYEMEHDMSGVEMNIRVKDDLYNFRTNLILPHNSLNFLCAISILESLEVFNAKAFSDLIRNISIPGRSEVINANGRTIVIDPRLDPALKRFKEYKETEAINKIRVVYGATGRGYIHWEKEFSAARYINCISANRKFDMDYVKKNANYVYLTSNDNGAESAEAIALELQGYLNNEVPSCIETDRIEAIRKAITESEVNDIILIAGRGNRRLFCDSMATMKYILDKEVVMKVLEELGWK